MVIERTPQFSNRDFDELVRKYAAKKKKNSALKIEEVLKRWRPGKAIDEQRQVQEILAAEYSTFPELTPQRLKDPKDPQAA